MRLREAVRTVQKHTLLRYVAAALISGLAVWARVQLNPLLKDQSRYGFLLPATLICTIYGGFGPGVFGCFLGALLTLRFVIDKDQPFDFHDTSDVGGLILFLLINIGILALARRETLEKRRRVATERELAALNEELEQKVAERTSQLRQANAELEGFCYNVAHDLRTPSRAIAGNARIMLEDHAHGITPELQNHLRRINGAALKLGALVDALLTYARLAKDELQLRPVRLDSVAAQIVQEERRRRKLDIDFASEAIEANADERQMRIMLRALIENALVYHKPGEPAHLRMRMEDGALVVNDRGIGFDMAYAHKVFMPFERLHRDEAYPGVGMGLANVERVVQRHRGSVSIEAVPGDGTVVRIRLPGLKVVVQQPQLATTAA